MSLTSSRVGLTHRCTIERRTFTSDGGGGQAEAWADAETDLPCRSWVEASRVEAVGDRVAEVEDRRVIVPVGSDVQPGDRVTVTLRGEAFLSAMPVSAVSRRTDHLEIVCREVT